MSAPEWLMATLGESRPLAPRIRELTLLPDAAYPAYASGSHLLVQVGERADSPANAYSLLGAPRADGLRIAVAQAEPSRGGSAWLHSLAPGDRVRLTLPRNLFPLHEGARRHLFIAGGIGITPFVSHLAALDAAGGDYQLHYAFRGAEDAAFIDALAGNPRVTLYDSRRGQRLDIPALLADTAPTEHVYACGPRRLLDALWQAGAELRADGRLHIEAFDAAPAGLTGQGFSVRLVRSGVNVEVGHDESILDAIQRQSPVRVDSLCREGYCGTCETRLLSGRAEHRDRYLSDAEQQAQDRILLCVSRAACERLELDL